MFKKVAAVGLIAVGMLSTMIGCGGKEGGDVIADAKLTVFNSSSDFVITVDSDSFKDSYDTIDLINRNVTSRGTPFITAVRDIGDDFICTIDEKFQTNNIVHIDAVGTQNSNTRYKLHGSNLKLEIETSSSNTISMSYNERFVNVRHVHGPFEYMFADNNADTPYQITIRGNTDKIADVKVHYNGEAYIISSSNAVDGLVVTTTGFVDKPVVTETKNTGMHFTITINADGSAKIQ